MKYLLTAVRQAAIFIDRGQWLILIAAAPWLLFPTAARSPIMLVVPVVWIVAGLAGRAAIPRTPLNVSVLALAVMTLISLYATYDMTISLPKIAGLTLGFGAFFAVARLGRERAWWLRIYVAVMALGVALAGVGLLGTQWLNKIAFLSPILNRLPPVLRGLPGAEEGFQPNQVAGTLLWILPLMLMGLVQARRNRRPIATGIGAFALLFVLGVFVLTQSRSGYIGLAAGLAVMLIVSAPIRLRKWLVMGVIVGIVAVGVIVWRSSGTPGDGALSLDTLEGRVEVWSRALSGIADFPLTGMGLNTFRHIVHVLYPLFLIGPDVDLGHAHNEFLQAALDLGLPGLIAFIALYLGAFAMLWHIWRTSAGGRPRRAFALGLGGSLLAHLVYSLTDAVALGAKPGLVFWLVLGLIAGLFEQTEDEG